MGTVSVESGGRSLHYSAVATRLGNNEWNEDQIRAADRVIFCLGEDAPHWDQNQFSPVVFWSHQCIFPKQNSNDWGENESVRIKIFETEQRAWSSAGRMASQLVEQCGGLLKIRKKRQPPDAHWMCCCQSVKTREADLWIESASRQLYCTLVLYWATANSFTEVSNAQLATVCNRRYHWYQVRSHLEHRCL